MRRSLGFGVLASMLACAPFTADAPADASAVLPDGAPAVPDGGATEDAGADTSVPVPVGCGWATFEDDFERAPAMLAVPWKGIGGSGSNTTKLAIDASERFEGKASLRADLMEGGMAGGVYLAHPLAPAGKSSCVAIGFALKVTTFPLKDGVLAVTLQLDSDTMIGVSVENGGALVVAEQRFDAAPEPRYREMIKKPLPVGRWALIELRYDAAPSRKVTVSIDGTPVQEPATYPHGMPKEVRAGVVYGKTSGAHYFIDSVRIR